MRPTHFFTAILITAVWGFNFIFIRFGLHDISPLMLCALRFFFSSIPAVFFIKKPNIPFKQIALYGLFTFGLQFALLFLGMQAGMAPGLTSLVVQIQVFFSLFFAALFLNETIHKWHILGALVSFMGIGVVWVNLSGQTSFVGLILVISAAFAWGIGNFITKKMGKVNGIALVVWGSFVAFPALFICSLIFEGTDQMVYSIHHLSWLTVLSLFYIVYLSTWFGYGAWSWLLGKYPLATMAPFGLLVPIFGMVSATLLFDEPMQPWKIMAASLVITGLCINSLGPRLRLSHWKKIVIKAPSTV